MKKHLKISRISALHFFKLFFRGALFVCALVIYIINRKRNTGETFGGLEDNQWLLWGIWGVFVLEMILRLFPSKMESAGSQKQFAHRYQPTEEEKPQLQSWKRTFAVAVVWILLNSVIFLLFFLRVIDEGILLLISLAYSVCDMICILFFCPFQTWIMKNKCCTSCRIYNWDYAMMFTPLVCVWHPLALSLVLLALALLAYWEIMVRRHPERFSEKTNACLSCKNCEEKLCQHKKQLQVFLKKMKILDRKQNNH